MSITEKYLEIEVTENTFVLEDLDKGMYVVTVHLDDATVIETDCPEIDGRFDIYFNAEINQ